MELASIVDAWIKSGRGPTWIRDQLAGTETPKSRITISKHKNQHMTSAMERERRAAVRDAQAREKAGDGQPRVTETDLARLIVGKVVESVNAGLLKPTIGDGLKAQGLIEQRASRAVNAEIMLQIVSALSGAWQPAAIEGEYRELDPEAIADAEEFRLLGSGI